MSQLICPLDGDSLREGCSVQLLVNDAVGLIAPFSIHRAVRQQEVQADVAEQHDHADHEQLGHVPTVGHVALPFRSRFAM